MTQINLLDAIILQIKAYCPIFNGSVTGTADYAVAFTKAQTVNLPVPAAYVLWLDTTTDENSSNTGYHQRVRETYRIVVALDNTADPRGQGAISSVNDIRSQLIGGLAHWMPYPDHEALGMIFKGGQSFDMDHKRLWIYFDFELPYWLDDEDVWNASGIPLTEVDTTYAFNNTSITVDDVLPQ